MSEFPVMVYKNTLVAVFNAAYKLGISPKDLAKLAKRDVAEFLESHPPLATRQANQTIDESVYVAKLIHEQGLDK